MASRRVRKRGMEPPYAVDQISACILHPIISTGFVVLSALSLVPRQLGLVLAPFVLLNVVVIGLWGYISWTDPAGEGGCVLRSKGADTPHYCNYCRKTVKGFDHHCSWLNTCISKRNYAHFYLLGVSGSLLYLYMSAVALLVLVTMDKDDQKDAFGSLTSARASWGVFLAVAGWTAVSFVALAGFHTYLLMIGLGTFDWVVLQNQTRQEKLTARRNAPPDSGGSKFWSCCGKKGPRAATAAPAASSSSVRDGGKASVGAAAGTGGGLRSPVSSRTNAVLAPGTGARGGWGGAGMGVGVTPTRSRGGSNASKALGTPAGSGAINNNGSSKLRGIRVNRGDSGVGASDGVDRLEP